MQWPMMKNADQQIKNILATVIKPELCFFYMQVQRVTIKPPEFNQPRFEHTPEQFNIINRSFQRYRFWDAIMYPE